jgi:hypothetical protein
MDNHDQAWVKEMMVGLSSYLNRLERPEITKSYTQEQAVLFAAAIINDALTVWTDLPEADPNQETQKEARERKGEIEIS